MNNWRDLLYFSTGEKRALIVLLILIAAATGTLLTCRDHRKISLQETEELHLAYQKFEKTTAISLGTDRNNSTDSVSPVVVPAKQVYCAPAAKKSRISRAKTSYPYSSKYERGTVIDLNQADTAQLKRVPGIGSVFASRIVKFRKLLGGFSSVCQLREVYGIDSARYEQISPWFRVDSSSVTPLAVNKLSADALRRHPYLSWKQARAIESLRKQKGHLYGWKNLMLLEEFTATDQKRLAPYLSFE